MNTDLMGMFLCHVGGAHSDREVVMVLDGASLIQPRGNIQPKFPGIGSARSFVKIVPDTLDAVVDRVKKRLERYLAQHESVSCPSGCPWIVNSILLNSK